MANDFEQLLDAAISHFERLKADGVRFVEVDRALLAGLKAGRASDRAPQPRPMTPLQPQTPAPVLKPSPPAAGLPPQPPRPLPPAVPVSREAKEAAIAELKSTTMACQKCPHLAASRRNVVFGVGNIDAELMFIGEAPGADEDARGEPFVGAAGERLTKIIQTMGLSRGDVYIANVLKCRPDTPGQAAGNRKPTSEEMQTCLPYLMAQIDLIRPRLIVALGAVAMAGLFGRPVAITKVRGQWMSFRDIPVMPTFHPAYLLHNESLAEKRKLWEDMLEVMEKLGLPVTEKHRGYFLPRQS